MEFKGTKQNWYIDRESGVHSDNEYQEIRAGIGHFNRFNVNEGFSVTGFISNNNANLILAAPDLIKSAIDLIESFEGGITDNIDNYNRLAELKKSVNKALGKSNNSVTDLLL